MNIIKKENLKSKLKLNIKHTSKVKKGQSIFSIPVENIRANPYQIRKDYSLSHIEELASSIRQYGVLQPIAVRKMGLNNYELIFGERRLKACQMLGVKDIPCILMKINDKESGILSLIENIHRKHLNFIEEGEGYKNLMDDNSFDLTILSDMTNKSHFIIRNKIQMLKLEDIIRKNLLDYEFTENHGKALLRLPHKESRLIAMERMISNSCDVKETEIIVNDIIATMTGDFTKDISNLRRDKYYTEYNFNGNDRYNILDNYNNKAYKCKREKKEKKVISDFKLCTNTIKQAVDIIRKFGLDVYYADIENDEFCEIVIRINKSELKSA